jgi:hypothetical protein
MSTLQQSPNADIDHRVPRLLAIAARTLQPIGAFL